MKEFKSRKTIEDSLGVYDFTARKEDIIQITEWTNGEGYDIDIWRDGKCEHYTLTHGEIDAVYFLSQSLKYEQQD